MHKLIVILFLFNACASLGEKYIRSATTKENAIIFIHGYYGSNLNRKKTKDRMWLNIKEILWRSTTVALDEGLDEDSERKNQKLEIAGAEDLEVDGIMEAVPVVPLLYTVDVYRSTLSDLEKTFGTNHEIIPFAYDWRKDNFLAIQALDSLIRTLKQEKKKNIIVIAHSMGGLIASYYLRYGAQDFENARENWVGAKNIKALILAGVPFQGTISVFRNMQWGVKVAYNKSLLQHEAVASFPSSYQLLPALEKTIIDKNQIAFLDSNRISDEWLKNKWGLLQSPSIDPISFHYRERFTRLQIERAQKYQILLNQSLSKKMKIETKILTVIGKSRKTLAKGIWYEDKEKNIREFIFNEDGLKKRFPSTTPDLLFSDGDESVTIESAQIPKAYQNVAKNVESIVTDAAHSDLYKDKKILEKIKLSIQNNFQ